ncbi:hypothetical protein E4582_11060 [Luteimonas yindakuii]|uniref:Uncharacterized protein n=1 Tax=Luteimonas yindakuii TaxID=2565782 RepID=A0A4Z1R2K7_9GAMM|nr:hypothetical protein [Luteimonas yindakuii]QCO67104.1 hypothetical protein E5843_03675 [Luteimonas yindakuii]TKS52775.1 hypothetical protein E4582_11060 [Luteimonas yindakuii]
MDNASKFAHIPGWGADLERENRPAVPMERTPPRLDVPWSDPPPQQPMTVEVLKSVERPEHSRTFGTRLPPKGLSGVIRRAAFKRSENDIAHWLMLIAADRVNVVEGLCEDVRDNPGKALAVGAGAALVAWWLLRDD